jgi:hypothetical protein
MKTEHSSQREDREILQVQALKIFQTRQSYSRLVNIKLDQV